MPIFFCQVWVKGLGFRVQVWVKGLGFRVQVDKENADIFLPGLPLQNGKKEKISRHAGVPLIALNGP